MNCKRLWKLYEIINKNPYKSSYDLAEMLKIKHKKIHKYLTQLLNDGLIKFEMFDVFHPNKRWGFDLTYRLSEEK